MQNDEKLIWCFSCIPFFRFVFTGVEYQCSKIDYFPKDEYSPDPNDSTMAIPCKYSIINFVSLKQECQIQFVAGIFWLCLGVQCNQLFIKLHFPVKSLNNLLFSVLVVCCNN